MNRRGFLGSAIGIVGTLAAARCTFLPEKKVPSSNIGDGYADFNNLGTTAYVMERGRRYQYDLSVPWDITTAVFVETP